MRIKELDSLRGLAALSVVGTHYLNLLPAIADRPLSRELGWLKFTPLHLLWSGHEAVVFFFVLSGLVLSLPFFHGPVSTPVFIVKRIARIGLPYWVAVILAFIACSLCKSGGVHYTKWESQVWSLPLTSRLLLSHLILIDSFTNDSLIPVVWSLVHEMRVSLLFPLLMAAYLAFGWKRCLIVSYLLACLGVILTYLLAAHGWSQDYLRTLTYLPMFLVGAAIGENHERVILWYHSLSRRLRISLWVGVPILYLFRWMVLPRSGLLHRVDLLNDSMTMLAVIYIIVASLASIRISKLLCWTPFVRLGEASYSLYLYHALCLIAVVHIAQGRLALPTLWIVGLLLTGIMTWASYIYVERSSVVAGKRLSGLIARS